MVTILSRSTSAHDPVRGMELGTGGRQGHLSARSHEEINGSYRASTPDNNLNMAVLWSCGCWFRVIKPWTLFLLNAWICAETTPVASSITRKKGPWPSKTRLVSSQQNAFNAVTGRQASICYNLSQRDTIQMYHSSTHLEREGHLCQPRHTLGRGAIHHRLFQLYPPIKSTSHHAKKSPLLFRSPMRLPNMPR